MLLHYVCISMPIVYKYSLLYNCTSLCICMWLPVGVINDKWMNEWMNITLTSTLVAVFHFRSWRILLQRITTTTTTLINNNTVSSEHCSPYRRCMSELTVKEQTKQTGALASAPGVPKNRGALHAFCSHLRRSRVQRFRQNVQDFFIGHPVVRNITAK